MKNIYVRTIAVLISVCACSHALAGSTINTTNRWAWSSGAGWLNCRTDATNGMVIGQYYCSGYMYSGNAGWIKVGTDQPTNGYRYTNISTNDYGVNHDGKGHLTGYAWSPTFGWISFEWTNNLDAADAPKINMQNGVLSGFAWGGSIGWIGLSNISAYVKTDWMTNGPAAANGLPVAWQMEVLGATNILSGGTNDYDHDGLSDYQEYVAGTHPTNSADVLEVASGVVSTGNYFTVTWYCESDRLYRIETNSALQQSSGWGDCGLGLIVPASNGYKTVSLSCGSNTQLFYRVKVQLPLSQ